MRRTIKIDVSFRRARGEVRLIAADRDPGIPRLNLPLLKALVRAHEWRRRLFEDLRTTFNSIAKVEGCTQRYVMRLLRLAFLAPDLVDAIVGGFHPLDLQLEDALRYRAASWRIQKARIGLDRS